MSDPRDFLMRFLAAMDGATARRCCITLAFENEARRLALEVGVGEWVQTVYIDQGDLAKPIDVLVNECLAILPKPQRASA